MDASKSSKGIIQIKYEGQLKRYKENGIGILIWSDFSKCQGQFKLGIIKGREIKQSGNGNIQRGYFEEELQRDEQMKIQKIAFVNENGSKLIIEKIRQQ
ncbi:unnamed protein product [Paramecium sonneborni]|uniref:Uncharacterized protein n=1 Tax=Paramecium sonneborni TaxID=65129 RepID=A0A8S1NAN8_9CILI|nr:unnamed protein product [Paramecium sonneborni]